MRTFRYLILILFMLLLFSSIAAYAGIVESFINPSSKGPAAGGGGINISNALSRPLNSIRNSIKSLTPRYSPSSSSRGGTTRDLSWLNLGNGQAGKAVNLKPSSKLDDFFYKPAPPVDDSTRSRYLSSAGPNAQNYDSHRPGLFQGPDYSEPTLGYSGGNGSAIPTGTTSSETAPVPEPSTMALGAIGLASLLGLRKKNKKSEV